MNKKNNLKKGFSLVELMIVVAVMAILATVGFFAYNNFQKTARDSKRKSDLSAMATALQACFSESTVTTYCGGKYPTDGSGSAGQVTLFPDGDVLDTALAPYGGKSPEAPVTSGISGNNVNYTYGFEADGKTYAICAQLEGATDEMWVVSSANLSGSQTANVLTCPLP